MNVRKKLQDKIFESRLKSVLPEFLRALSHALGHQVPESQWLHPKKVQPQFYLQNHRCRWVIKYNEKNTELIDEALKKINASEKDTIGYYCNDNASELGSIILKFDDICSGWKKIMKINPSLYFHNPNTLLNFSIEREDEFLPVKKYIEDCYIIQLDANAWYYLIRDILDPLHVE